MRKWITVLLLALLQPGSPAFAEDQGSNRFSTEQLEQLVAPIALYPDPLLTQVLMASTYPLEVVEAQRWLGKNAKLKGDALEAALKDQDWDPSVKSLVAIPDVINRMGDNLDWTQDLGDAFLEQQNELMDTVQRMRAKALEAGNLKTTEQQVVTQQSDKIIVIQQASPEVVYVPTYSPTVVYGSWYYPRWYYPPMYYPPPPGYGLVTFGLGMAVGGAIWGNTNWGWGNTDIDIDINRYNEFNRNTSINSDRLRVDQRGSGNRADWQHDPAHRKGVNYRDQSTAQRFGASGGSNRVTRDQARGYSPASAGTRDLAGGGVARAGGTGVSTADRNRSPGAGTSNRSRDTGISRDSGAGRAPSTANRSRDSAFSGSRNPSADRAASSRGAASRGSRSAGSRPAGGRSAGRSGGGGGRRR